VQEVVRDQVDQSEKEEQQVVLAGFD
jgi:hypothetical protein